MSTQVFIVIILFYFYSYNNLILIIKIKLQKYTIEQNTLQIFLNAFLIKIVWMKKHNIWCTRDLLICYKLM